MRLGEGTRVRWGGGLFVPPPLLPRAPILTWRLWEKRRRTRMYVRYVSASKNGAMRSVACGAGGARASGVE
jgi:hypothetical protein